MQQKHAPKVVSKMIPAFCDGVNRHCFSYSKPSSHYQGAASFWAVVAGEGLWPDGTQEHFPPLAFRVHLSHSLSGTPGITSTSQSRGGNLPE